MKEKILNHIKNLVAERIKIAFDAMQAAQASANEEGKSSAGDKYETGRAMAQIERDKYAHQYQLALQDKAIIDKINENIVPQQVGLGSLVETMAGNFFLAISIGLIKIDGKDLLIISPQSPVGALLFGKKIGDNFIFRGKSNEIVGIS